MSDSSDKPNPIILYEGNFPEWLYERAKNFTAIGHFNQAYPAISHIQDGKITYHSSKAGDIQLILDRITPALKARMPVDDLEAKAGALYAFLEKLCKPFRLFILPAELRNKIYEEAVWKEPRYQGLGGSFGGGKYQVPRLAQSTQQLRSEVLPIFYSVNVFAYLGLASLARIVLRHISCWRTLALGASAKHLRHFKLEVCGSRSTINQQNGRTDSPFAAIVLKIKFDKSRGLSMEYPSDLDVGSKMFLTEFVAQQEKVRKKTGAEGEAIVALVDALCEVTGRKRQTRYGDWLNLAYEDRIS